MAIKARKLLLSFTLALMLALSLAVPAFAAGGSGISQVSNIHQSNFNNQIGGDCIRANCSQVNVQSNRATVSQRATVTRQFSPFFFKGHRFHCRDWDRDWDCD